MKADGGWRMADSQSAAGIAASPAKAFVARTRHLLFVAPLLLVASACGNIEPWVKPYERQSLADPIMSFDLNPVSTSYMDHVYEAREGARGALGSAGGGCGCN